MQWCTIDACTRVKRERDARSMGVGEKSSRMHELHRIAEEIECMCMCVCVWLAGCAVAACCSSFVKATAAPASLSPVMTSI